VRLRARLSALATVVGVGLAALSASAEEQISAEKPEKDAISPYEQQSIVDALHETHTRAEPAPEGKLIEEIVFLRRDVIDARDPLPDLLNTFHWRSQERTIRRQMLFSPGDRYQQELIDETARNLRQLRQLSLVLLIPVQGSTPERIRLLVITKDVWSLRLNTNFRFAGGRLEYLVVQPSEDNFFGLHHVASGQLVMDPATYSLGARYELPRIGGSHLLARASANVIVNRESGDPEGSFGVFTYGQPLYSTRADWAWSTGIAWRKAISRRFVAGQIAAYDADVTPEEDGIPYTFHSDVLLGVYRITRSFGRSVKHDFTLSAEANRSVYRSEDLSAFEPRAAAEFVDQALPVSDTRIGPGLQYRTYSTRFLRAHDFETLALEEDFRLGHDAYAKVYPVFEALSSTRDMLGFYVAGAYSLPLGDGLARVLAESTTELADGTILDGSARFGLRLVSPRAPFGRVVYDGQVLSRYENHLNLRSSLGGETRPRGYASQQFLGKDLVVQSLELRSRPLELWTVQVGGAAFLDAGDAFDGFSKMDTATSAGFGIRALLPMFNRVVFRADWGFPLSAKHDPQDGFPGDILVTFKQAFPMPSVPFLDSDPYE
jgi:hypothetical protein